MIENIINSYNTDRDLSDIDVLLELLIELENLGVEEVFVNNEYFNEPKQIISIHKKRAVSEAVYLSISDMDFNESINLIKGEKERNNINYTYSI
ncbi:hypothetical protein N4239_05015 [Brachyspira hyodysenteriae]|uniref:hypothetical protein n=1 Tax=Brachyspira hyodysenteriae TaxID=159 RepID=UPI002B262C12|nr:hypothetical protein [Brachyspira hyodysenteriae]WPC23178.1 hypothetical protein N4239_09530 [Brachyspira hyodysenteriae]WPC24406.1 hypothetical protein N4239_01100 [Brachyspira hyodysenteriae]WPC25164.1 hypothetical protein N4239_05015 [Brachyspira hyodysenteriae]